MWVSKYFFMYLLLILLAHTLEVELLGILLIILRCWHPASIIRMPFSLPIHFQAIFWIPLGLIKPHSCFPQVQCCYVHHHQFKICFWVKTSWKSFHVSLSVFWSFGQIFIKQNIHNMCFFKSYLRAKCVQDQHLPEGCLLTGGCQLREEGHPLVSPHPSHPHMISPSFQRKK